MRPIPTLGFGTVLADVPSAYEARSEKGLGRSPQRHYACMSTPDICALWDREGLDAAVARDCVLVFWTTWPMLARGDAHAIVRAWRFTPVTGGDWMKTTRAGAPWPGTGHVVRGVCEPFLVATRGRPKLNPECAPGGGLVTVDDLADFDVCGIVARRRRHSEKPDEMHRLCETAFPAPGLELFARKSPRPGWTAWGDQVGLLDGVTL